MDYKHDTKTLLKFDKGEKPHVTCQGRALVFFVERKKSSR